MRNGQTKLRKKQNGGKAALAPTCPRDDTWAGTVEFPIPADVGAGRTEQRLAVQHFDALGDANGGTLAHAALLLFIGVADDDYTGREAAAATLTAGTQLAPCADAADALLAEAGARAAPRGGR